MADEGGAPNMEPRAGHKRTEKAVEALSYVGLERDLVIRTLKKLYKAYKRDEGMWKYIEMDNYEMLADEACILQTKLESRAIEKPKKNGDHVQSSPPMSPSRFGQSPPPRSPSRIGHSSPPRVARGNSYPERSATALKLLATDIILKEEEAGKKAMQRDGNSKHLNSTQKNSSLLHSRGGITSRTDGRGVKMIEPFEVSAARRKPDDSIVNKKLKQRKEEIESHSAPTTSRQISNSQGLKKLKRSRQEGCRRELKELVGEVGGNSGEARGSEHDIAPDVRGQCKHDVRDLSRGFEEIPIPIVNQSDSNALPSSFFYINKSIPHENAFVNLALSRIGDDDCCPNCHKDCLSAPHLCACVRETGGEFAYTLDGCLDHRYIYQFLKGKQGLLTERKHFCESGFHCPLERHKNEECPANCKGHPVRDFVKECSSKCGCSKQCGNRVVQRGIRRRLEVFMTPEGKGWGIRTLEDLPAGAFVFEYVGEILTNTEMWERNNEVIKNGEGHHTYPITLDADWGSEANLKDEEALCLDATYFGNVARFLNHRCQDANLLDMPVEIESPDRHFYHVAFFTSCQVKAQEELTWDYGIDFEDEGHPIPAFNCMCGSDYCRGKKTR